MGYKEQFIDLHYIKSKDRDKTFWKVYENFLDMLHNDKPIFLRGLLSVVISEHQDYIRDKDFIKKGGKRW